MTMTTAEAVREVEFWTTNLAGTAAYGTTSKQEVGEFFNGTQFDWEKVSNPGDRIGWAVSMGATILDPDDREARLPNPDYELVVAEIERRAG